MDEVERDEIAERYFASNALIRAYEATLPPKDDPAFQVMLAENEHLHRVYEASKGRRCPTCRRLFA